MMGEVRRLTQALAFTAEAHRNHRRKGGSQEPYINHLIEVLDLVASVDAGDMDVLIAALLHDVLEDTRTSYDELVARFGERVARIVQENSDDMTLPKAERYARIAFANVACKHTSTTSRLEKNFECSIGSAITMECIVGLTTLGFRGPRGTARSWATSALVWTSTI